MRDPRYRGRTSISTAQSGHASALAFLSGGRTHVERNHSRRARQLDCHGTKTSTPNLLLWEASGALPEPTADPLYGNAALKDISMEEKTIDRAAMGRLAKALVFVCGPDHPTTVALRAAAESGSERDLKNARTLFLRLKPGERKAALAMLDD